MLVRIATGEYKYNTGKKVDHIADHRSTKWTRIKRQPTRDQFKEKQSKKKERIHNTLNQMKKNIYQPARLIQTNMYIIR